MDKEQQLYALIENYVLETLGQEDMLPHTANIAVPEQFFDLVQEYCKYQNESGLPMDPYLFISMLIRTTQLAVGSYNSLRNWLEHKANLTAEQESAYKELVNSFAI